MLVDSLQRTDNELMYEKLSLVSIYKVTCKNNYTSYKVPSRGGSRKGNRPPKTYESNFFTMILYNSENSIRDIKPI